MLKKIFTIFLAAALCLTGINFLYADETGTAVKMDVRGYSETGATLYEMTGYEIGGRLCLAPQDLSYILKNTDYKFALGSDYTNKLAWAEMQGEYTGNEPALKSGDTTPSYTAFTLNFTIDGNGFEIPSYIIDNVHYSEIRSLCEALGIELVWNANEKSVSLTAEPEITEPDYSITEGIAEADDEEQLDDEEQSEFEETDSGENAEEKPENEEDEAEEITAEEIIEETTEEQLETAETGEAVVLAVIYASKAAFSVTGKPVCLTFDDGPTPENTDRLLAALTAVGGHATFFVVGERVAAYPELVKHIVDQGSQVGNHSYSHATLTALGTSGVQSQMYRTSNAVYDAAGVYPYIGRAPGGSINSTVTNAVNIAWFNWNLDTNDWKYRDSDYVYNFVLNNIKEGDVVLMHDLHKTTIAAVERLLPVLKERGYTFVTIDEMAELKGGYENIPGYVG